MDEIRAGSTGRAEGNRMARKAKRSVTRTKGVGAGVHNGALHLLEKQPVASRRYSDYQALDSIMAPKPRTARQPEKQETVGSDVGALRGVLFSVAERIQAAAIEAIPNADPHQLTAELVHICEALSAGPGMIRRDDDDVPKLMLRSRLIGMLRSGLIRYWSEVPPPSHHMLNALHSFERAQAELEAAPMYDEVRQRVFDSRGLELVVELAHDLRSPLTSILFLSETLMRGGSGSVNELQQRQLGIVYSAALGLISTASDVIELARGGEHVDISEATSFSLAEILQGVRDMVMPIAEEKKLDLFISSVEPDRRFGHPVPLSRVLLNLTTNALKFTDVGHVEISVKPLADNRVEISVRDTGRGIEDAALETLFQPIRRRSGGRRGYQIAGTGLGLSICRKLVSAMNSELQLETHHTIGTRFFFELDLPAV
jgi:signal transduction histidine kinase